jgi:phage-related protein
VLKAIGSFINAIVSLVSGVILVVTGILNFFRHLITGDFSKLGADLMMIWNGLWSAIVGTLWNLILTIWNLISGFVEGVVGFFQACYDVLVGHSIVPDMVNAIIDWFASLPKRILGVIGGMVSWVIGKFVELKDRVVSYVSELVISAVGKFRAIVDGFASAAGAVRDKVSDLMGYVAGIPSRILSALGNLGGLLYSAGRDVVSGLISGISSMAGSLMDRARSLADSVKNAVSGALQIGSPSKVMMRIGRFVTEGLINGIMADVADLSSAMSAVASVIRIQPAMASQAQLSATSGNGASINIENYIAPKDADPFEQAEAWAWLNNSRGY